MHPASGKMIDNGPLTPLSALDAVVLDTETTGLDARTARLVQVGAVRMQGAAIFGDQQFDQLVNPGIPIPKATTAIHGITDEHVKGAPGFAEMLDRLDAFLGSSIIIGHTIGYDLTILDREAKRIGRPLRPRRSLDVRTLAELARPNLAQYDLDRIAAALDIEIIQRHTAIGDAIATAKMFAALLPLLRNVGIRTLAEAETASRALGDRQAAAARQPLTIAPTPVAVDAVRVLTRVDSFTYTHRVRDVMSAPPIWSQSAETVREAIQQMLTCGISSVLVKDAVGTIGIATERDMLRALAKPDAGGLDAPLAAFVSKPLHSIGDDDFVYRAIGRMERLGIRHLGVTDAAGAVTGVITTRNLLRHRASQAIVLGDAIDRAGNERDLGRAWASIGIVARSLLDDGVGARDVSAVISCEICALTRRAAELAETRMADAGRGSPPTAYALLVLGSAGRGESLLAADQDNALVFADGPANGAADLWFAAFATAVAQILDEVGIPFCKGGVMAKNAVWRHSLSDWRTIVDGWIQRQRPEDILNVDIFFDGTTVHGDTNLGTQVFNHAFDAAHRSVTFQKMLSETARRWTAPVSLFGNLKTDEDGRIDFKKHGLLPMVTAGRALSIRHGCQARSTAERFRAAMALGKGAAAEIDALIDAHAAIMAAMLDQQLADGDRGIALSPRVDLSRFGKGQVTVLRDAIRQVATAVDLVSEGRL